MLNYKFGNNGNQFVKHWRDFFLSNSFWGKLLGAFFGYLAAGPVGALVGVLIGNVFDKGINTHLNQPFYKYHAENREEIQSIFFKTTFSVLGHIAKADGRVSEEEIRRAKLLMDEMQLKKAEKEKAKQYFNEGKSKTFDLISSLDALYKVCSLNPELLKLFMDIQYQAAKTDGLTQTKIHILNTIFKHFGLAPLHRQYRFYQDFNYEQNQSQYQGDRWQQGQRHHQRKQHYYDDTQAGSSLDQAYAILEVDPGASKQEVKKAYRVLISKNHPDKLISQGLPEAMIKMANEKTQKIRKAYEFICSSKGWHH